MKPLAFTSSSVAPCAVAETATAAAAATNVVLNLMDSCSPVRVLCTPARNSAVSPLLKATRELPNADCARMLTSGLRVRQGALWKESRHLPPSIGGGGFFGQKMHLEGKPKRDRQHHSPSTHPGGAR